MSCFLTGAPSLALSSTRWHGPAAGPSSSASTTTTPSPRTSSGAMFARPLWLSRSWATLAVVLAVALGATCSALHASAAATEGSTLLGEQLEAMEREGLVGELPEKRAGRSFFLTQERGGVVPPRKRAMPKIQVCGKHLNSMFSMVCAMGFNKRKRGGMSPRAAVVLPPLGELREAEDVVGGLDGGVVDDASLFLPAQRALAFARSFSSHRVKRGAYDECCAKPCYTNEIEAYCRHG